MPIEVSTGASLGVVKSLKSLKSLKEFKDFKEFKGFAQGAGEGGVVRVSSQDAGVWGEGGVIRVGM